MGVGLGAIRDQGVGFGVWAVWMGGDLDLMSDEG